MVQTKRATKNKQVSNTNISDANSYESIRKVVLQWPSAMRTTLAYDILGTLVEQAETPRPKRDTLSQALGLADNGQPPPTDEEVEQWLDERRINKQEETPHPRKKTLHLALGLFDTGQTPPTDEEVQEMIDEYRMEKYG